QRAGDKVVAAVEVGPHRPVAVVRQTDRAASRPGNPLVLLDVPAEDIVGVRRLEQEVATVSSALLDAGQLVAVVVAESPGLGVGALALLGEVPFVVVGVGVDAVVGELVVRASGVAGHRPIAIGIVGIRLGAVVCELVGVVVGVTGGRATVECLRSNAAGEVIGVGVVFQDRARAVLVLEVLEPAHGVVRVVGLAHFSRAGQITVA